MSRRPGLGSNYMTPQMLRWHKQTTTYQDTIELEVRKFKAKYYAQDGEVKRRLPRFYKDKIFTSGEKARYAAESILEADQQYRDELARISRFCDDPSAYYDERLITEHDLVGNKCNTNDLF